MVLQPRSLVILLGVFHATALVGGQVQFIPADIESTWWRNTFRLEADPTVCPPRENPRNGSVAINENVATYSCNDGYTLTGTDTLYCSCGGWIGDEPLCRRDGSWSEWSPYTNCTASCGGGRQTRQRTCTNPTPDVGGKDCAGSSGEAIECNAQSCPGCPLTGTLTLGPLTVTVSDDERNFLLSCVDGFSLTVNNSVPCTDIDLSTTLDLCLEACPNLVPPLNGSVVISADGRLATYTCQIGFTLLGSSRRSCVDGVWTGADPTCAAQTLITREGAVDLSIAKNQTVELLGIDPGISLPTGRFEVRAPEFLAVNCSTIVTFRYRTTTSDPSIGIGAQLFAFNTNDPTGDDDADFSLVARVDVVVSRTEEATFACLQLECVNSTLLPAVSHVVLSVDITSGIFEFDQVKINERSSCFVEPEALLTADCDNTTSSGDCGFRNTGCGSVNWQVNLNANDIDDVDPVVDVQSERVSANDDCDYHVCLPCLQQSGYTVTQGAATSTPLKRKRRTVRGFRRVSKHLCLPPPARGYSLGTIVSSALVLHPSNAYVSFDYVMFAKGLHQFVIYVFCDAFPLLTVVHIKSGAYYSIDHYNGEGKRGTQCLALHHYITRSFPHARGLCKKFRVAVDAVGVRTHACISNVKYLDASAVGGLFCETVNNL